MIFDLFCVEQVWFTLYFELFYIVLPSGSDFFSALAFLDHLAYIVGTDEEFEERTEEMVIHIQVAVSIDDVSEVHTTLPDFFVAHVAQVHTIALLVKLWRILCT